jgi:hypothetical protein
MLLLLLLLLLLLCCCFPHVSHVLLLRCASCNASCSCSCSCSWVLLLLVLLLLAPALLLTCILLLLLLPVLLRFALGFGQLAIFHIKQQVFSLQLRTEVQFQSQNEKTGLRGVFFGPF